MLAIFDLDGTLIDSKLDLAHAVNATLREFGHRELSFETVYSYVGNGAPVLIRRAFPEGTAEAELQSGLDYFIRYYEAHRLDYTTLYEGIRELLEALRQDGVQMAVLTNKPVRISGLILEGLGVADYFARVYGGNSFASKKPDPEGVFRLFAELHETAESTVFIGDSSVDIQTARNAGVAAIGVTYGFQPESLASPTPDLVFDHAKDVLEGVRQLLGRPTHTIG